MLSFVFLVVKSRGRGYLGVALWFCSAWVVVVVVRLVCGGVVVRPMAIPGGVRSVIRPGSTSPYLSKNRRTTFSEIFPLKIFL